jgi:hypothetical protein
MNEDSQPQKDTIAVSLPVDYQLGERLYKEDLYIENYIVKIEIYRPKDKNRRPTRKTINRIFRTLGQVQIMSVEEARERGYTE